MKRAFTEAQHRRIRRVTRRWGIAYFGNPMFGPEHQLTEALLHELSHAVSLGVSFAKTAPVIVSRMFNEMNATDAGAVLANVCEARAIAVERIAVRRLGLKWAIDLADEFLDDVLLNAEQPMLPFGDFKKHVCRFERTKSCSADASRVVSFVERVVSPAARRA